MKATLLEIASRRTQPQELPGLEAMMPESPCIALLNNTRLRSMADLAVISGDLAPEGIWQQLKTLAVDALFCEDNDLVVNTAAWKDGPEKRCCLASARDFYAQAFERAEAAGSVDNYAGLNAATIAFLLGPNGDRARWTAIVQQCADEAVRRTASGNTF